MNWFCQIHLSLKGKIFPICLQATGHKKCSHVIGLHGTLIQGGRFTYIDHIIPHPIIAQRTANNSSLSTILRHRKVLIKTKNNLSWIFKRLWKITWSLPPFQTRINYLNQANWHKMASFRYYGSATCWYKCTLWLTAEYIMIECPGKDL